MLTLLTLNEAKKALNLDNDFSDETIKTYIAAGTRQLKQQVGFEFGGTEDGLQIAKLWLVEYVRSAYFSDYNNKDGMNEMIIHLQEIAKEKS